MEKNYLICDMTDICEEYNRGDIYNWDDCAFFKEPEQYTNCTCYTLAKNLAKLKKELEEK